MMEIVQKQDSDKDYREFGMSKSNGLAPTSRSMPQKKKNPNDTDSGSTNNHRNEREITDLLLL